MKRSQTNSLNAHVQRVSYNLPKTSETAESVAKLTKPLRQCNEFDIKNTEDRACDQFVNCALQTMVEKAVLWCINNNF